MTGFNVNCKDCSYCRPHKIDWNDENNPKVWYVCDITGLIMTAENNTDCCDYEPKRADN